MSRASQVEVRCLGKDRFPTRENAQSVIRSMQKRKERGKGSRLVAYTCSYCGAWHVGSELR